jgi:hypothetical protein
VDRDLAAGTKQAARSLPGRIGDAMDCVAALGTRLIRANLADPLQHLNGHAVLAQATLRADYEKV